MFYTERLHQKYEQVRRLSRAANALLRDVREFRLDFVGTYPGYRVEQLRHSFAQGVEIFADESPVRQTRQDEKSPQRLLEQLFNEDDFSREFSELYCANRSYNSLVEGFSTIEKNVKEILKKAKEEERSFYLKDTVEGINGIHVAVKEAICEGLYIPGLQKGQSLSHNLHHLVSEIQKENSARAMFVGVSDGRIGYAAVYFADPPFKDLARPKPYAAVLAL